MVFRDDPRSADPLPGGAGVGRLALSIRRNVLGRSPVNISRHSWCIRRRPLPSMSACCSECCAIECWKVARCSFRVLGKRAIIRFWKLSSDPIELASSGGIVVDRSGPDFVRGFFRDRELNHRKTLKLDSVDGLWDLLLEDHLSTVSGSSALSLTTADYPLFFRGQTNESHGISTSLYRFIQNETGKEISEALMAKVETAILDQARGKGLGKGLSDGHLLMLLQHYGSPTRLLDVSTGPMEALFFATEGSDRHNGRLFIFKVNNQREWVVDRDLAKDPLPWASSSHKGGARSDWTEEVSLLAPLPIDPRMGAQESRFLIGGLIRANPDRNIQYGGKNNFLDRKELPQISTLSVAFLKQAVNLATTPWHALGWSIRIPAAWKPKLRERLADINITRDSMYPPFATVQWESAQAGRHALNNA